MNHVRRPPLMVSSIARLVSPSSSHFHSLHFLCASAMYNGCEWMWQHWIVCAKYIAIMPYVGIILSPEARHCIHRSQCEHDSEKRRTAVARKAILCLGERGEGGRGALEWESNLKYFEWHGNVNHETVCASAVNCVAEIFVRLRPEPSHVRLRFGSNRFRRESIEAGAPVWAAACIRIQYLLYILFSTS